jgi:hypothetical protein
VVADPVTDRLRILSFLHIAELRMLQPQSGR